MYSGYVLASHELFPGLASWLGFWQHAQASGASSTEFFVTLRAWSGEAAALFLASVVMGPLLWAATILINDVHDLAGDRINPRKARSPLVQGLVRRGWAHGAAYAFAGLSLIVAWSVNVSFFWLTAACVVLAWLYSAPPVRLKTVPGGDVLVNAVGVGVLAGLAGWSLAQPLSSAPYPFVPQSLLLVIAIYVPTTLVDYEADQAANYRTFATALGYRRAFLIGWVAWVAANGGAVLLSWNDLFLPRRMLGILVIFVPLLLIEYWLLIGRARDPAERLRGIVVSTLTFFAVNLVFVLMYTGWWV